MIKRSLVILLSLTTLFFVETTMASQSAGKQVKEIIELQLKDGSVKIELFPDIAPNHVNRIKALVSQGFYNNIVFHRVIDGFMVQTGDPTGTGMGGSDLPDLQAEFNDVSHVRGVASMARSNDPNSANSQFFIVLEDSKFLDGQYTVWGKVIEGMEYVDNIKKGSRADNGKVDNPDKIISMKVIEN